MIPTIDCMPMRAKLTTAGCRANQTVRECCKDCKWSDKKIVYEKLTNGFNYPRRKKTPHEKPPPVHFPKKVKSIVAVMPKTPPGSRKHEISTKVRRCLNCRKEVTGHHSKCSVCEKARGDKEKLSNIRSLRKKGLMLRGRPPGFRPK